LFNRSPDRILASLVVTSLLLVACGSTSVTPGAPASPTLSFGLPSPSPGLPASSQPAASAAATGTTGFAFAADDIAAYYRTQGYACVAPQPSTKAAGFTFRTCQKTDQAARTQTIGLVTDPAGALADAVASVKAPGGETFLAPLDALDPLLGFLGAILGEEQGAGLLTWLASHLGDTFAQTMSGALKVATYTESADDPSTLYIEVANEAYLDAPAPSPSP
jgi:hypothetical protein